MSAAEREASRLILSLQSISSSIAFTLRACKEGGEREDGGGRGRRRGEGRGKTEGEGEGKTEEGGVGEDGGGG